MTKQSKANLEEANFNRRDGFETRFYKLYTLSMNFDIITIFPNILDSYFKESILGMAVKTKKVRIKFHDLRKWTKDKHRTVDDTPYGGGAGMIMKIKPICRAVKAIKKKNGKTRVVLLSAKGKPFNQKKAQTYLKYDQLILICGRYEGVDQRVADYICDEEVSIGQYVLTGGELGAAVIMDSVMRLIPGILGNQDSLIEESFTEEKIVEYPQYTKPKLFKDWKVPSVLLSGNHQKIKQWKEKNKKML
ncbi:MAG: tRNA (guanosine(37)-N1)-methyltransferase TrmD [Patescibacteria group bacterium]|nr:tRNA (guanosine(37)-N1)-methyltransferase TrmD [Patescibacteria group bacterium]